MISLEDLMKGASEDRTGMGPDMGGDDEFVDSIDNGRAVLVRDGKDGPQTREVPVDALPKGTREGDVVKAADLLYGSDDGDKKEPDADADDVINSLYAMPR